MRPFKSGQFLAHWLLRLVVVFYIGYLFFEQLTPVDLNSAKFYIALVGCLLALLLLLGGLLSKQALTVIAGIGITILFAYLFAVGFQGFFGHANVPYLMVSLIGFYFFTKGN